MSPIRVLRLVLQLSLGALLLYCTMLLLGEANRTLDTTGPSLIGAVELAFGTASLVASAFYCAWAHRVRDIGFGRWLLGDLQQRGLVTIKHRSS